MGNEDVGGLVGENKNSSITNSYATGSISGNSDIGGLVALQTEGSITNSYATGPVSSFFDSNVGGLVGDNEDSNNINNSYWDTVTSQTSDSDGGTGQTDTELKSPTAAGATSIDVYYQWSTDNWDFGTPNQYPTVKYAAATVPVLAVNSKTKNSPNSLFAVLCYQDKRARHRPLLFHHPTHYH